MDSSESKASSQCYLFESLKNNCETVMKLFYYECHIRIDMYDY